MTQSIIQMGGLVWGVGAQVGWEELYLGKGAANIQGVDRINKYVKNNGSQLSYCYVRELEIKNGRNKNEHCGVELILEVAG